MASGAPPDEQETLKGVSSAPPAVATIAAGTVTGRYTILEQVGAGGMGEVFAAYDAKLDRKVALKVLKRHDEDLEARLLREAQAMARLAHANVVAVFDTGRLGDKLYLTMEFVRGQTLRAWQKAARRNIGEVLRVYSQAGEGLAAAHAAGIVHRDFKPDNVLIAEDGRVKVTDFGIARAVRERIRSFPPPAPAADAGATVDPTSPTPAAGAREVSGASTDSAFALARDAAEFTPSTTARTPFESTITQDGALLGTPGYMAPEQFLGLAVDERTDQFAFCVSLYQALYGEKPFQSSEDDGGKPGLAVLAQRVLLQKVSDPPKGSNVPAHVRRVVLRGLSADREARYLSMRELLVDLARDPTRQRKRLLGWAGVALATAALASVAAAQYRRVVTGRALVCKGSEEALDGTWDDARKRELQQALVATRSPIAEDTWARVEHTLDAYAHAWVSMRTEACEATRVHGQQSDEAMTLRMACLDRRREEIKAFVDVFAKADEQAVEKAAQAALGLTPLDGCADLAALRMPMPPPEDPAARARVDALRPRVAELKALYDAGKYREVVERGAPVIREAEDVRYRPLEAELRLWTAMAEAGAVNYEAAVAEGTRAVFAAVRGGHQEVAARASAELAIDLAALTRWPEAKSWLAHGRAVLEHMGQNTEIESLLERAEGAAVLRTNPDLALRRYERARELWEKTPGANPAELGTFYDKLAVAYNQSGRFAQAAELYRRSLETYEKALGPSHPLVALPTGNLSLVLVVMGRYDEAEKYIARLKAMPCRDSQTGLVSSCFDARTGDLAREAAGMIHGARGQYAEALAEFVSARRGSEEPYLMSGFLTDEGMALSGLGRHEEALAAQKQAVSIRETLADEKSPLRGEAYNTMGWSLRLAGRPREALSYHERALAIWSTVEDPLGTEISLDGIANCLLALGRNADAVSAFERAIAIVEKAFGDEHPNLADMLSGLGRAELGLGRPERARPVFERAIAIAEASRLDPRILAEARFGLAQVTWQTGGAHETARQLALTAKRDAALARYEPIGPRIDAWLATHRRDE